METFEPLLVGERATSQAGDANQALGLTPLGLYIAASGHSVLSWQSKRPPLIRLRLYHGRMIIGADRVKCLAQVPSKTVW